MQSEIFDYDLISLFFKKNYCCGKNREKHSNAVLMQCVNFSLTFKIGKEYVVTHENHLQTWQSTATILATFTAFTKLTSFT
jgi:hypothetical protein